MTLGELQEILPPATHLYRLPKSGRWYASSGETSGFGDTLEAAILALLEKMRNKT